MGNDKIKVLLIEDNPGDARLIKEYLDEAKEAAFHVEHVDCLSKGLSCIAQDSIDAILLDLSLPDSQGLDSLGKILAQTQAVPIVVLSGLKDEAVAIKAVQQGAQDYLVKGNIDSSLLVRSLHYAIERQRLSVALRESENSYRLLADNIADVIWKADLKGRITYVSPSIKNFLGYTVGETVKLEMKDILTPDSAEQAKRLISDQIALWNPWVQHAPLSLTLEHIRKDGSTLWSDVRLSFLCDEKGRIMEILGVTRDVTDRKKAEEAISESENQYRSLVETASKAGLGITIVQKTKAKEAVFVFVNDEYCKISGYSREELLGRSSFDTIPPENLASIRERYGRRQEGGTPPSYYESTVLRKDGTRVPIETSVSVFIYKGKPATVSFFKDITERKKAENALQKSEERYRLLADNAVDVIWTMDIKGRINYVSPSIKRLFGYSVDEVMALQIKELLSPDSAEIARKVIIEEMRMKTAVPQNSYCSLFLEHVHKDGSTFWTEVVMSFLRDEHGGVTLIQGVTRDITERKKAESALRESEARFRTVFEGTSMGIALVDFEGKALSTNPAFERMLGYNLEEFKEIEGSLKYQYPDDAMVDAKLYIEILKGKREHYTVDKRYIRKDGGVIWGRQTLSVVRDDEGKPKYFIAMLEDITERKWMEQALRESEERYRELFENANDIIYTHDLAGNFTSCNKGAELAIGFTRDEIMGMNIAQLLTKESLELARQMIASKVNQGGGSTQYEVEIIAKDGHHILLDVSSRLIFEGNKPISVQGIARDVTGRKKMEQEIIRLSDAVRMSTDSIIIADLEGNIIDVNEATVKMQGAKSKSDLVGLKFSEFMALEEREKTLMDLSHLIEEGYVNNVEYHISTRDGRRLLVETNASVMRGRNRELVGIVAVSRDITERKKMEEALRESEERFRRLVDHAPDIIFRWSVEKGLQYVSPIVTAITGYTPEELKSSPLIGLTLAKYGDVQLEETYGKVLAKGVVPPIRELSFMRKDGEKAYIDVRTQGVRNDKGEIVAFEGIVRDITDKKLAEEALRQSEQSYRVLLESTHDSIIVVDAETFKITFGNRRSALMFGFDPLLQEGVGMNLLDFIHPEDREIAIKGFVEDLYQSERRRRYDVRAKTHDDREIWVSALGTRIEFQGRVAVLLSLQDVTKDKQIEEEKRRLEEQIQLAGRLAVVGELAAGVAHELNNPIAAIQGFAQLLKGRKDLDTTVNRDLETIYKESQRAAKITQNLLTFARKHEPETSFISLNEALQKTLELHAHQMKVNNIELVVELAPDLPKTMADYYQMQQVFMNIINNAEQAMVEAHGKGRFVVKTRRVARMIQVTFTDDGPGIPEENLDKVFDPFFTTKEVGKGTGLGLSICYGLVQAHGGRIYAESKLGKGTTFVVEIPIVSEKRSTPAADLLAPDSRGVKWKKPEGQY